MRFRVDGTLREVVQPNRALHAALISRLKIMAELDIAEKRLPQDGMVKATGLPKSSFCMACYDGNYPVAYDLKLEKNIMERRRARVESLGESLAKEELQTKLL